MFNIQIENGMIHNGFTFYPLSDKNSFGFMFRYGKPLQHFNLGSKLFTFRYSKLHKQWIINNFNIASLLEPKS